jgi:hypothetical protein
MVEPKLIGHAFNAGRGLELDYFGPVFATPQAFFLTTGPRPAEPLVGTSIQPRDHATINPFATGQRAPNGKYAVLALLFARIDLFGIGKRVSLAFADEHKRAELAKHDQPFVSRRRRSCRCSPRCHRPHSLRVLVVVRSGLR